MPMGTSREEEQRQCCHCRCSERLVVLCCPLGQAAGTHSDASTNFTDSMKEEAARGLATQQVSRGSAGNRGGGNRGGGAGHCATARLPPSPFGNVPVTFCLCASRATPGPARKMGALKGAQHPPCPNGSCGLRRSCGS